MRRQVKSFPCRVVYVKGTFKIARHRDQPSCTVRRHPYGIQFKHIHPVIIIERPQSGKVLDKGAYYLLGRAKLLKGICHVERFKPCERVKGNLFYLIFGKLFYVNATVMGYCHDGRPEYSAL